MTSVIGGKGRTWSVYQQELVSHSQQVGLTSSEALQHSILDF